MKSKGPWGGKRAGAGRPLTAHLRLMHLASCIDDWTAEEDNRRGSVMRAMLEIYEMEHADGEKPRDLNKFLRTMKRICAAAVYSRASGSPISARCPGIAADLNSTP